MKTELDHIMDPTTLCRVCMAAGEDHFTNLFDKSLFDLQTCLHEMLQVICAPVFAKSASDDVSEMPALVCNVCRDGIIAAFNLHQQCIETDRRLNELLTFERELHFTESNEIAVQGLLNENGQLLNMVDINEDEMLVEDGEDVSKTCSECGKVFARRFTLLRHQKNGVCPGRNNATTPKDPLLKKCKFPKTCLDCGKEFERKFSLNRHLRKGFCPNKDKKTVVEKKPVVKKKMVGRAAITCAQCGKTFARTYTLFRHKRTGSCAGMKPKIFPSRVSENVYDTSNALQGHYKKHSDSTVNHIDNKITAPEQELCCKDKKEYGNTIPGEVIHDPSVAGGNMVMIKVEALDLMDDIGDEKCSDPADDVTVKSEGETAEQQVKNDTKTCSICSETIENMAKLKFHMRSFHQLYVCEYCDALFPTRHILWYHKLKHKEPNVTCAICGKKLASKYSLELHMLSHAGKKTHSCELCSMRFTTRGAKSTHMRIHKKERPFVCDICGKRVVSRASLGKHIREIHEKIKRFVCTVCTRKFATKSHLTCHMLSHTKEKPYKCKLCSQAYSQTNDLVRHVSRAHWSGKPYPCDRCDESFRIIEDLREHYRVHVASGDSLNQMEEVRFNSMAIMDKLFARIKQQHANERGLVDSC